MKGDEWLRLYPELPSSTRDGMVLEAVSDGTLHLDFKQLTSHWKGNTCFFSVTEDAGYVLLGDGSRFRPMCSAWLLQQVADLAGASLPTELTADLVWEEADVQLTPCFFPAGAAMVTRTRSIEYNRAVEGKRGGRTGLLANVGKFWLLHHRSLQRLGAATNYGLYSQSTLEQGTKTYTSHNGYRVVQPVATAHDHTHQDYSQTIQLISGVCIVNGEEMKTAVVLEDAERSGCLTYDQRTPTRQM